MIKYHGDTTGDREGRKENSNVELILFAVRDNIVT